MCLRQNLFFSVSLIISCLVSSSSTEDVDVTRRMHLGSNDLLPFFDDLEMDLDDRGRQNELSELFEDISSTTFLSKSKKGAHKFKRTSFIDNISRSKREAVEDTGMSYQNLNIQRLNEPITAAMKLEELNYNNCNQQSMSSVFELTDTGTYPPTSRSVFVLGSHLYSVDKDLQVTEEQTLYSALLSGMNWWNTSDYTVRVSLGVVHHHSLYLFQVVSTGIPENIGVKCEYLQHPNLTYLLFKITSKNGSFHIEELSHTYHRWTKTHKNIPSSAEIMIRASLMIVEEKLRISVLHHIGNVKQVYLNDFFYDTDQILSMVTVENMKQISGMIYDVELLSISKKSQETFIAFAKDEITEIYTIIDDEELILTQEIELSNIRNILFVDNIGDNFLILVDSKNALFIYKFDGDQFVIMQSLQLIGVSGSITVSSALMDKHKVIVMDSSELTNVYQLNLVGKIDLLASWNVPSKQTGTLVIGRSVIQSSFVISQQDFKQFLVLISNSEGDRFDLQTIEVELETSLLVTIENLPHTPVCIEKLEPILSLDNLFMNYLENLETNLVRLNESFTNELVIIDIISASLQKLKSTPTVNLLLKNVQNGTNDFVPDALKMYDIATKLEQTTTSVATNVEFLFKPVVFKTRNQVKPKVDGLLLDKAVQIEAAEISIVKSTKMKSTNPLKNTIVVDDALTKTLRIDIEQEINIQFRFQKIVEVINTRIFQDLTQTSVKLSHLIDGSRLNEITELFSFQDILFTKEANFVLDSTINSIHISNFIKQNDFKKSTENDPVVVAGTKTFLDGLQTSGITAQTIDEKVWNTWYQNVLFKEDQESQTVNCLAFTLIKINVLLMANIWKLDNLYISSSLLSDIVQTDEKNLLVHPQTYLMDMNAINVKVNLVNNIPPNDFLINGTNQKILKKTSVKSFDALKLLTEGLNGVDILDVAIIDQVNEFDIKVQFKDVTVSNNLYTTPLTRLDNGDFSIFSYLDDISKGKLLINDSLTITTSGTLEIGKTSFGAFKERDVSDSGLKTTFLFKNTFDQVLPQFNILQPKVYIQSMEIKKTLDNFILFNLLHTSGNETIENSRIKFKQITTFLSSLITRSQGSTIGGVHVQKLFNDTVYDNDQDRTHIFGKKKMFKVSSHGNIRVNMTFLHNQREFVRFTSSLFVVLKASNIFIEEVKFVQKGSQYSISVSKLKTSSVTSDNPYTVKINGKNIIKFYDNVVKNDEKENIKTSVEFDFLMNGKGKIDWNTGLIDGLSVATFIMKHIMIDDDSAIERHINTFNINFENDIKIVVNKEQANNYFGTIDLLKYIDNLYINGSISIRGRKTLSGNNLLIGDLAVYDEGKNGNFAFQVNLPLLVSDYLSKGKEQNVSVEYTIQSVFKVSILTTDVVDGIHIDKLCFTDKRCTILCTQYKGIEIKSDLTVNDLLGNIKKEETYFNVLNGKLKHNLDVLEVEDISWGKDDASHGSPSDLYKNLVVKSNYDYELDKQACPDNCQSISGKVTFNGDFLSTSILIKSKIINREKTTEIKSFDISQDCAWKDQRNSFQTIKKIGGKLSAPIAEIGQLEDSVQINDVNLDEFLANTLFAKSDFIQLVTGKWNLHTGFNVTRKLLIGGEIDGVKANDFVRNSYFTADRIIPKLSFKSGFKLHGALITPRREFEKKIKDLLETSIFLEENESIDLNLIFNGGLQFSKNLKISTINRIPFEEIVQNGRNQNVKYITGKKRCSAPLTIKENVVTDYLNGLDLSLFHQDALRVDRDELINKSNFSFVKEVQMNFIDLPGLEKMNLEEYFWENLPFFIEKVHTFYENNIVSPFRNLREEMAIRERINYGKVKAMEYQPVPEKYRANETIVRLDTVKLNEAEWAFSSISMENSGVNSQKKRSIDNTCLITTNSFASSISDQVEKSKENTFRFSFKGAAWTVSSLYQDYNETCSSNEENKLFATGLTINPKHLNSDNVGQVYAVDINRDILKSDAIGYVSDVVMWDYGHERFIMVISSVHPKMHTKVLLFKKGTWHHRQNLMVNIEVQEMKLYADTIEINDYVEVQLLISLKTRDSIENEVWLYFWDQNTSTFGLKDKPNQKIRSPNISGLSLMAPGRNGDDVMLVMAASTFSHSMCNLLIYRLNYENHQYVLAELTQKLSSTCGNIKLLKIKEFLDYKLLFLVDSESLKMYKFIRSQGFQLLTTASIKEIVDIDIYEDYLSSDRGVPGASTMINIRSKIEGVLKTSIVSVYVEGQVNNPLHMPSQIQYGVESSSIRLTIDGNWNYWSSWSDCSASCGSGTQYRKRVCDNPAPSIGGKVCLGRDTQFHHCLLKLCPSNGRWSDWTHWTKCSASCGLGFKEQYRQCNNLTENNEEVSCFGNTTRQSLCYNSCCPQFGGWSEWESVSACDMNCKTRKGEQTWKRHCNNPPPRCGGKCQGNSITVKSCESDCPIIPKWGEWGAWSECSKSCKGGVKERSRVCYERAKGTNCRGSNVEKVFCNNHCCPNHWKQWGHWSKCNDGCEQTRQRESVDPECSSEDGDKVETKICNPVNGGWSGWTNWSQCSDNCTSEKEIQTRLRSCNNPQPFCGGSACLGNAVQTWKCALKCSHWTSWGEWSECSKSCTGGIKQRTRQCNDKNGQGCKGNHEQTKSCGDVCCSEENEWGSWSECSMYCNQTRTRESNNQECGLEMRSCNENKCNSYCLISPDHTMCKHQGISPTCNIKNRGVNKYSKKVIVNLHNNLRRKVAKGLEIGGIEGFKPQPQAANMHEIVWDEDLEEIAQHWADQCIYDYDINRNSNGTSEEFIGQNIGMIFNETEFNFEYNSIIEDAWYSEVTNPGFNNSHVNKYVANFGTAHYSQLIWATTKKVGCGTVYFSDDKSTIPMHRQLLVCNYYTGNSEGNEVYKKGKSCTKCDEDFPYCSDGLCSKEQTLTNPFCLISLNHTMCKHQGISTTCKIKNRRVNNASKEVIVDLHNELRRRVAKGLETDGIKGYRPQPEAANMIEIMWDNNLEEIAQRWADQCTYNHDVNRNLNTSNDKFVGQNIGMVFSNTEFDFDYSKIIEHTWYREVKNPGYNSSHVKSYVSKFDTAHYSQMIWANTQQIGCGTVYYLDDKTTPPMYRQLLVCNYNTGGNSEGNEVYKKGTSCTKCPEDFPYCADGLCSKNSINDPFCLTSPNHTMCKYRDISPTCKIEKRGVNNHSKKIIVDLHNKLRRKVANGLEIGGIQGFIPQPSAANMIEIVWDNNLAEIAQRWADQCTYNHDMDRKLNSSIETFVGQNIGMVFSKTEFDFEYSEIIEGTWYREVKNPGFNSSHVSSYVTNFATAHYSQMVWANTQRVGCGTVYFLDDQKNPPMYRQLLVCNYYIGGNSQGNEMYKKGTSCTKCPEDFPYCANGLCSKNSSNDPFCLISPDHTMCKYRGISPTCKIEKRGVNSYSKKVILDLHNELRRKVANGLEIGGIQGFSQQPSAANMIEIVWDNNLEEIAQRWADQCIYNHDIDRNLNSSIETFVGQNIGMVFSKTEFDLEYSKIVKDTWYREVKNPGFNSSHVSSYVSNFATAHYSQMVWAYTQRVGCGTVYYFDDKTTPPMYRQLLVCNYYPGGNLEGNPLYHEGTKCTNCPETFPHCSNSLCSKIPSTDYLHNNPMQPTTPRADVDNKNSTFNPFCHISLEHTMCKFKQKNPKCNAIHSGINEHSKKIIVDLHNMLRRRVAKGMQNQPTAANMLQIEWDENIATIAQRWADQCIFSPDNFRNLDTTKEGFVGQNIGRRFSETFDVDYSEIIEEAWFNEVYNPGFNNSLSSSYVSNLESAHYSQMTWAKTLRVGCGDVYYNNGTPTSLYTHMLICNYHIGGNIDGESIYQEGTPCSKCPANFTDCLDGLCSMVTPYCNISLNHTMCKFLEENKQCDIRNHGIDKFSRNVIVNLHNKLRRKVAKGEEKGGLNKESPQPPAANMLELIWNAELATMAQRWADQCNFDIDFNRNLLSFQENKTEGFVEQLIGMYSGNNLTRGIHEIIEKTWYEEVNQPGFNISHVNSYVESLPTKHYSQIVWANTRQIGCGAVEFYKPYTSLNLLLLVCNYNRGGKQVGEQMYLKGENCSNCPSEFPFCLDGLCTTEQTFYCSISPNHTLCKYQDADPTCKIQKRGINEVDKVYILQLLNEARQNEAAGLELPNGQVSSQKAINMSDLVWDDKAADMAQCWADQCTFQRDCVDCNGYVGQNLARISTNHPDNMRDAYLEAINTTWNVTATEEKDSNKSSMNLELGDYRQMVDQKTFSVGCGAIYYKHEEKMKTFFVCNFH